MWRNNFAISVGTFVLVGILALGSPAAFASEITDGLKATIDKVVDIVTDDKLRSNKTARRQQIRKAIERKFNYQQMVMRSLAQSWNDRTPQEKEEFLNLFKKLMENSYASKIEHYSDEKIEYVGEIVKGNYALVKTHVIRKDGTINVDYKLINEKGEWKVYDFVIEGVSMIRNYKSQFTKIIRNDSYDALVRKLADKIADLEANDDRIAQGSPEAGGNL